MSRDALKYRRVLFLFQPTKLNVYKNDAESWDYTTPTLGESVSLFFISLISFFISFYRCYVRVTSYNTRHTYTHIYIRIHIETRNQLFASLSTCVSAIESVRVRKRTSPLPRTSCTARRKATRKHFLVTSNSMQRVHFIFRRIYI